MKISWLWLNEFVSLEDYHAKPGQLAELLINAGLEVEAMTDLAKPFHNVVTGIILEKNPHPNADRLTLCQVTTGDGVIHQIVCGAKNHNVNDRVVVALPSAVLPGNFAITKSKIRGIESAGMLCSEKELGLATESEGIMILPKDTHPGLPMAQYLGLNDILFDIKVTPNRADCLSHLGLARELACLLDRPLKPRPVHLQESGKPTREWLSLEIKAPELCPRYAGRIVSEVKVGPSPDWLKRRLEALGLRAINNVVDVTNYVMLELGQPLHAFDLRYLGGAKIVVDLARAGESFTLLDKTQMALEGRELMIRDGQKPVALAGIMGGLESGIQDDTQTVFIESAYFQPATVRRTARRFGLQTDASYRFSRGVNPEGIRQALDRAAELLQLLASGRPAPEPFDYNPKPFQRPVIEIDVKTVADSLGYAVDAQEFSRWMLRLGCGIEERAERFLVTPPAFRDDLQMDMDLVEEFARLHGYHFIPETLPSLNHVPGHNDSSFDFEAKVRERLWGQGFQEALNPCFINGQRQAQFLGEVKAMVDLGLGTPAAAVPILNPLNDDTKVMRAALVPGLAQVLTHNVRYGQNVGRIFELGYVFGKTEDGYTQQPRLALLGWGQPRGLWQRADHEAPVVLQLKQTLENLLDAWNVSDWMWREQAHAPGFLHPGQTVGLQVAGKMVGFLGALHPLWCEDHKIREPAALAEFNLEALRSAATALHNFSAIVRFPVVERDLAFVMPKELPAGEVAQALKSAVGSVLQSVAIFDSYEGAHLPEGNKSVAFRLRYQDPQDTLTEERINALQFQAINSVSQKFSIRVR